MASIVKSALPLSASTLSYWASSSTVRALPRHAITSTSRGYRAGAGAGAGAGTARSKWTPMGAAVGVIAGVAVYQLATFSDPERNVIESKAAPPAEDGWTQALGDWKPPPRLHPDDPSLPARTRMANLVYSFQNHIISALEHAEGPNGARFYRDTWKRPNGEGGGVSAVLSEGKTFEKAGVLVSVIEGNLSKEAAMQMKSRGRDFGPAAVDGLRFFAAGLSSVIHPRNPHAPTAHLNYRYFEVSDKTGKVLSSWYGGGADLTPIYLYPEDATHFHSVLKSACDKHNPEYYPKFKKWADKYFWNTHREEGRGVGGIFFDDLDPPAPGTGDRDAVFRFVETCGSNFPAGYLPIVQKRKDTKFTEEEKRWQQLRRGRYVEFNLIHDRGTKFGLATPGARIESILVSMPLTARWEYMHKTKPGTRERQLEDALKNPQEWV
ncbi:hypothetical protein M427DRAFT_122604 [Gonapodya prolifera JEL478]|uniref:coproporphyrinogen oxidase n=1 Tax=Gonapodya prolifera (strain JEL478) TaxID=1344416 RepID=A0A139AIP7_GONPJ|nr:hypothetical protein M427DRAFT_122604 [Gonapodya prolifera JEL478]|eukprot:KXS16667.1 hypothetical protein M427DRAFT_122604 [Gonapodya prolifera JEL478]